MNLINEIDFFIEKNNLYTLIIGSIFSQFLSEVFNSFTNDIIMSLLNTDVNSNGYNDINEIKKLINDHKYLDELLAQGASKAEEIAGKKINEMKKIIGF